ncbi:hypothetical protein DRO69_13455 [Candidatus Bathyarchaeota archaeon]|nr:MAG: hypothetical protein DRO69_13455 [Candidatus Bathyarchaeota archaeon]
MKDIIKHALTRKIHRKGSHGKDQVIVIQPSEKLVLGVKFAMGMTICLSALEVAHMAFLGSWSSEIFAAITGLSGSVIGVLIGKNA